MLDLNISFISFCFCFRALWSILKHALPFIRSQFHCYNITPPKVNGSLRRASQDLYDNNQGRLKMAMGGEELFVAARARKFPSPLAIFSPLAYFFHFLLFILLNIQGRRAFPPLRSSARGTSPFPPPFYA